MASNRFIYSILIDMISVSEKIFRSIVADAIDNIPQKYYANIKNLAFVVEDNPNEEQSKKLGLGQGRSLYGLYEGIPLTKRGNNYNLVLPDKITVFKHPIEQRSASLEELKSIVYNTVWHEVAHYYGLDHNQIRELEQK